LNLSGVHPLQAVSIVKHLVNRIILSKTAAKTLIRPILRLHSQCYKWAGRYAVILNDGVHPKHHLIRYKEWFVENIERRWTILDVGCGAGAMPELLAQKAVFVYGIEIDKDRVAIAQAERSGPNIEYICGDAATYNYDLPRPIHCVTMSNVLEHIEHRVEFLKRLDRVVKWADRNHRFFLFRVPAIDREWIVLYKKELGVDYRLDPTHRVEYTLEHFERELNLASLVIRKVKACFGEIYAVCEAVSP